MKPISKREQEYRRSLYIIERRAIIPLKWMILLVTFVLWYAWLDAPVASPVALLFAFYTSFNVFQTYFFYFSTVTVHQIKPLTLISFLADVIFVSMLIYFDLTTIYLGSQTHIEFYPLYFLVVMRGFALFKTLAETIFVNLLISVLYGLTFYLQTQDFGFLHDAQFAKSLTLIWLVILMSWLIITVTTRQQTELMEVNERLQRTDSLARIGEMAAGIAHEINNPIGIIATTAEYLKMATPPGDERIEEIDAIQREAMRCKRIVGEMLTYANPKPVGTIPIDPQALNDEVLRFVFPRMSSDRLTVERDYAERMPLFEADPNLVKQALLNLYMNARQAIPNDREGRIIARVTPGEWGRRVLFEVEDNGVGIADEDMEHLFDPFFTRKAGGTGLGLSVTQSIVEKFDGTISVRHAKPSGTVFTLSFPAAKEG